MKHFSSLWIHWKIHTPHIKYGQCTNKDIEICQGPDLPKGLEMPFDVMANLAAVCYPFEYERGIVLKGFHTILVVTKKWTTNSGSSFQWHFADSKGGISLSKYTDDTRYHVWEEQEKPAPEIETVRGAVRTFLGWNDIHEIQPRWPPDASIILATVTPGFDSGIIIVRIIELY